LNIVKNHFFVFPKVVQQQFIGDMGKFINSLSSCSGCCIPKIITRNSAIADKLRDVLRSVKVTKHGTIPYVRYCFLLVSYSNFVRKTWKSQSRANQGHRKWYHSIDWS